LVGSSRTTYRHRKIRPIGAEAVFGGKGGAEHALDYKNIKIGKLK